MSFEGIEKGLPEKAYLEHPTKKGQTIVVLRGESGYRELEKPYSGIPADELNKALGITSAQAEAMKVGSMFGWNVPGADPRNYE